MRCCHKEFDESCISNQELTKSVFPKKALMLQKFYMQYYMRKPVNTSVSEYRARVTRLNLLIESFPPFLKNQGFSDNELKAMVYFNFPKLYTNELNLQDFDFTKASVDDLYNALERVEPSAQAVSQAGSKQKKGDEGQSSKKKKGRRTKTSLARPKLHSIVSCMETTTLITQTSVSRFLNASKTPKPKRATRRKSSTCLFLNKSQKS